MTGSPSIWLNQPGDYSGDSWHIAGAMLLDPRIGVVQTVGKEGPSSSRPRQARAFYERLGLADRVRSFDVEDLASGLRLSRSTDRVVYNHRHVDRASECLRSIGVCPETLFVYQATAALVAAAACDDHGAGLDRLAREFVGSFPVRLPEAAARVDAGIRNLPRRALFIIGRYAKYHRHFNASPATIEALVRIAADSDREPVLFADASNPEAQGAALRHRVRLFDPYDVHPSANHVDGTPHVDMQVTTYFWSALRRHCSDCLVVGGRSGSTDVASFMGMRVVEWDRFDALDPESLRLARMAPAFCSTLDIPAVDQWHGKGEYLVSRDGRHEELQTMSALEVATALSRREIETARVPHVSRVPEYVQLPHWMTGT